MLPSFPRVVTIISAFPILNSSVIVFSPKSFSIISHSTSFVKMILLSVNNCFKNGSGNASKSSYKSSVEIAPSNLCFEPGDLDLKNLMSSIDKGVFITELQGLHAGINAISGDFSLQCHGYCIDKGVLSNPVSQITVSGNFFELLKEIDAVANDFFLSPLTEDTGSASVRVKELNISGK